MQMENINIKCQQCGKTLAIKNPGRAGIFQVACPNCQHQMKLQLKPRPLQMANDASAATQQPTTGQTTDDANKTKIPVLKDVVPEKSGKGYVVRTIVDTDKTYALHCACCGKPVIFKIPEAGLKGVRCRQCATLYYVKATTPNSESTTTDNNDEDTKEPKPETQPVNRKYITPGMLTWGKIFRRNKIVLREKTYILGRNDQGEPSDIMFDDSTVSRRSAQLQVEKRDGAYFFKFTVLRAANPVFHNSKQLAEGESIYLRYNDTIQLGRTIINFKKAIQ